MKKITLFCIFLLFTICISVGAGEDLSQKTWVSKYGYLTLEVQDFTKAQEVVRKNAENFGGSLQSIGFFWRKRGFQVCLRNLI